MENKKVLRHPASWKKNDMIRDLIEEWRRKGLNVKEADENAKIPETSGQISVTFIKRSLPEKKK